MAYFKVRWWSVSVLFFGAIPFGGFCPPFCLFWLAWGHLGCDKLRQGALCFSYSAPWFSNRKRPFGAHLHRSQGDCTRLDYWIGAYISRYAFRRLWLSVIYHFAVSMTGYRFNIVPRHSKYILSVLPMYFSFESIIHLGMLLRFYFRSKVRFRRLLLSVFARKEKES